MPWRPMSEQESEHARHDRDRGRYGKTVPEAGSGEPCPAWCRGPGRPEQACDRCRQVAASRSEGGSPTVWGRRAPVKRKPTYEEEHNLTPQPQAQSDQAKRWDERVARENAEIDLWRQMQNDLDTGAV